MSAPLFGGSHPYSGAPCGASYHGIPEAHPHAIRAGDPIRDTFALSELDAAFDRFIDYAGNIARQSVTTLRNYRHAYLNFRAFVAATAPDGARDPAVGLTSETVDAWSRWNSTRASLRARVRESERRVSNVALHTWWRNLRSFCAFVEAESGTPNPFLSRRPPVLPERVPRAIPKDDCGRLLDAAANYPTWSPFMRARAVAVLAVAMYAGLRRGDMLRLRFADVNLRDETIWVERGKGRGGGKQRLIAMSAELRHILVQYIRERQRIGRRYGVGPATGRTCPEFFCSSESNRGMSDMTLRRIVESVRDAAQVPFTLHALRHSFVTELVRSGAKLPTVSHLAGHTKITTTEMYFRSYDPDNREAVRRLSFRKR